MTQNTWKAVGMLLLAGLVGGAVSSAAMIGFGGRRHMGGRGHGGDPYVEMLARELDLTAAQRDTVRAILDRHRPGMDSIWIDVAPRMKAWREGVRDEIRTHLDSEQQRRYAEYTARRDAEREGRGKADSTHR